MLYFDACFVLFVIFSMVISCDEIKKKGDEIKKWIQIWNILAVFLQIIIVGLRTPS